MRDFEGLSRRFNDRLENMTQDDFKKELRRAIDDTTEYEAMGLIEREPSEWAKGAASARDSILCSIIGMQNMSESWTSPDCIAYRKVYGMIVETYGDIMKPFKY